ncbi:hypothetical protein JOC48_001303 [Aquibacillus albus]|uniref:Uncharacterized protein n=1 Tax=Aquibacillus albus TaxID=1168171 RepID=A0ABS2MYS8_9BACI|nr:hypothetical protein [Aquibacillus albus]
MKKFKFISILLLIVAAGLILYSTLLLWIATTS